MSGASPPGMLPCRPGTRAPSRTRTLGGLTATAKIRNTEPRAPVNSVQVLALLTLCDRDHHSLLSLREGLKDGQGAAILGQPNMWCPWQG